MAAVWTMNKNRGYPAVDGFRLAAALLVVANHTSPLLSLTDTGDFILTRVLARFAVPFFFMASGFFMAPKDGGAPDSGRLWRFTKKVALMYAAAMALYLPLNVYMGYFSQPGLALRLLRDVFIEGTFYHLWYFPGVLLGVWVAFLLRRFLGEKGGLIAAAALYLIGVGGDSWFGLLGGLPGIGAFYGGIFAVTDYTRNGLFFAPLFLLLGMAAARHRPTRRPAFYVGGLVVTADLMLMEALLLRCTTAMRHDSMYLMLPAAAWFLFRLLTAKRGAGNPVLRSVSMLVYIVHPWCIVLVRGAARVAGLTWLLVDVSPVFYICVAVLSLAVAFALWWLGQWWKNRGPGRKARAWTETDGEALRHNLSQLRGLLPGGGEVMGVVKANAYGHGAVWTARTLQKCGVRAFAVASAQEGFALRRAGVRGTILVLGYTPPGLARKLWLYRLTQTAVDLDHAATLSSQGVPLRVHLKVDTGMHRLGTPFAGTAAVAGAYALPHLRVGGIFTHLSLADSHLPEDVAATRLQIGRFYALVDELDAMGIDPGAVHLQSSYGLLNYPGLPCHYARIGIALYGTLSAPADVVEAKVSLWPVLALRARVASVRRVAAGEWVGYGRAWRATKDCLVATLAIGYADGIPRHYTGGRVLLHGASAPIIGRISMDQLSVLIDEIPGVAAGDIATLIGQDGAERITAGEVAQKCGTLTNEILSRLGARVTRCPLRSGQKRPEVHAERRAARRRKRAALPSGLPALIKHHAREEPRIERKYPLP